MKIKKIKKYIPTSLFKGSKFIVTILKSLKNNNTKSKNLKFCPICATNVEYSKLPNFYIEKFKEHDFVYSLFNFETLNLENYSCNNCGASDRDRLVALYLKNHFDLNHNEIKLLDFAPSGSLFQFLNKFNLSYRSADLYMDNVDDKVDIRDMTIYQDNTFDIFICSHVLEHIDDDITAMEELYRITKKGGFGICLVPIMLDLENSVEDKIYLDNEHLRWKYFGQDDHVRMYSKTDFVSRLENTGFRVCEYGLNYFGKEIFSNTGIDYKSVLYVVKKL